MLENEGFGVLGTCRRDRLPGNVPNKFFHHKKHAPKCPRAKLARFFFPIVAVTDVPAQNGKKAYQRCHVSMQSTSSTNFSLVNSMNSVHLFTAIKCRGKDAQKRFWAIEMNEARLLYLKTYGKVDQTNARIKKLGLGIKSMKYVMYLLNLKVDLMRHLPTH